MIGRDDGTARASGARTDPAARLDILGYLELKTMIEPGLVYKGLQRDTRDIAFRFNRHYVEQSWRAFFTENPNRYRLRMPAEGIFTNRLHWGLYSSLAQLEAQADWRSVIDDVLGLGEQP
jgi:hypothetical protein